MMTSTIIQKRLAVFLDYQTNICVPNTLATGYEADLLCLMASGYLDEYEIKISVSDLRKEFSLSNLVKAAKHSHLLNQSKHPRLIPIRKFTLCVPTGLIIPANLVIPEHIGIIRVPVDGRYKPFIERKAKLLPGYRKLYDNEKWTIVRLGYLRYWNYHQQIVNA